MNKTLNGMAIGLFALVICIVALGSAAADGGRMGAAATVTDQTQLPAEILTGTQLTFKANFSDPEGDVAAVKFLVIDGLPGVVLNEESAADTNTTDGKVFLYTGAFKGGAHTYVFSFFDGTNWTNTTSKTFDVRYAPAAGDWTVSGPMVVENATIELKGNLNITSGGILELRNTTIKFNGDTDGKYGISVQSGGVLKMSDKTVITKATGAKAYLFWIQKGSTADINNCEIWYAGWENVNNNSQMGVFVEADTIVQNTVIVANAKGIIAENCKLTMKKCTVKEAYRRNVECTKAVLVMEDCLVYHSTDACNVEFFQGTDATLTRCTIQKNGHNGIWMKDGAKAVVTDCLITESNQNGIWMDNGCTLTVTNTVIEKSVQNGMWINGSSTVTATNVTIRNNGFNGTWISGGKITMTQSTIDTHELHGFAGFDGVQVIFTKNFVNNSKRHNYETTNGTTLMEDCNFAPSREACNVEFFIKSKATVKNTKINGAGHNCFWLSDNVEVTIEGGEFSSSPNNIIWANLSSKVTVKNCILRNAQKNGIWAADSTITVEGCTIKDNGLGNGPEGWGIEVENCVLTVTGCTFTNNPKGQISVKYPVSVKVVDSKGKGITGATVKITDQNKTVAFTGTTDANGAAAPGLMTGSRTGNDGKKVDYSYTVTATKGAQQATEKGVTLTGARTLSLVPKEKVTPKPGFIPGFETVALVAAIVGLVAVAGTRRKER